MNLEKIRLVCALPLMLSAFAAAQDGALPRGKKAVNHQKIRPNAEKGTVEATCRKWVFQRPHPLLFHQESKKAIYLVSRLPEQGRDYLLKYHYREAKVRRLSSLRLPAHPVMMPDSSRVNGFVIVSFADKTKCLGGEGQAIALRLMSPGARPNPFAKYNARVILNQGSYFVTWLSDVMAVGDLTKRALMTFDIVSFQKRRSISFLKGDLPMSYHSKSATLVALRAGEEQASLVALADGKNLKSEVKIGGGYKVLQEKGRFAFVRPGGSAHQMSFRFAKKWSGALGGRFNMSLPIGYDASRGFYQLDFATRVMAVYLGAPFRSRRWAKAFLFELDSGKQLASLDLPKEHYVDGAVFVGGQVVFLLKTYKDKAMSAIRHFSFESGRWLPVHFEVL